MTESNNLVKKVLEIIGYFKPKYWYLENPQTGKLKDQSFMEHLPYNDVDYCKYGFDYRKRTRIWNNNPHWSGRVLCKKNNYCQNKKEQGKHINFRYITKGGGSSRWERRISIPKELIQEIIKKSIELNCKVIITTDHGTINVKTASKVIGDKNTSQNLRYKTGKSLTYNLKDNISFNDPHKINLPKSSINASYIFAKEDFYLVYPNNFNYYSNFFKNTYQHGGVSFEELIIPFIVLNS